jgi:prepilin-type N-terminal cleavage/methylation domain-containing protein
MAAYNSSCVGFNKRSGLTLLELVACLVVISLLAAVALPTFERYRRQSYEVSGLAELRQIVDAEIIYPARTINTIYMGSEIHCRPGWRFSPLFMMHKYQWEPPQGELSFERRYYQGYEFEDVGFVDNDGGGKYRCFSHWRDGGHPWALGVVSQKSEPVGAGYWSEYLHPSYFIVRAGPDEHIAQAYSVPPEFPWIWLEDETWTGAMIADFDGYRSSAKTLAWKNHDLSSEALTYPWYTWLMRSMYWKNGEVNLCPGVVRLPETR